MLVNSWVKDIALSATLKLLLLLHMFHHLYKHINLLVNKNKLLHFIHLGQCEAIEITLLKGAYDYISTIITEILIQQAAPGLKE